MVQFCLNGVALGGLLAVLTINKYVPFDHLCDHSMPNLFLLSLHTKVGTKPAIKEWAEASKSIALLPFATAQSLLRQLHFDLLL